jgi:hypothetical protein
MLTDNNNSSFSGGSCSKTSVTLHGKNKETNDVAWNSLPSDVKLICYAGRQNDRI